MDGSIRNWPIDKKNVFLNRQFLILHKDLDFLFILQTTPAHQHVVHVTGPCDMRPDCTMASGCTHTD